MNGKNTIYPYPILSPEKDDYVNSQLDAGFSSSYEEDNLIITYDIQMDNTTLNGLIRDNIVKYLIFCEDIRMSFRQIYMVTSKQGEIRIPLSRLDDRLDISLKMVAVKEIHNRTITGLVKDYKGMSFNFNKGTVLGYTNIETINIQRGQNEENMDIIFAIIKKDKAKEMSIDLSDDNKVKIYLTEKDFEKYVKFSKNPKIAKLNITGIIFPALVDLLYKIHSNRSLHEDKKWYKAIFDNYKQTFKEELDLSKQNFLELAQKFLEKPIARHMKALENIYEG